MFPVAYMRVICFMVHKKLDGECKITAVKTNFNPLSMLFPLSLPQMRKSHFSFNVKLFLNVFWRQRNSPFQEQFH